ncbi:hypothetical protein PLESTF_001252800 [Pleodorina starrii]|nr:hypothetical protein PLESTF_001252800 [Pleodorina starrii]
MFVSQAHNSACKPQQAQAPTCQLEIAGSEVSAPSGTPTTVTPPAGSISLIDVAMQPPAVPFSRVSLKDAAAAAAASSKDVAASRAPDQSPRAGDGALSPRLFVGLPIASVAPPLLPFTDEASEAPLLQYLAALGSKHSAGLLDALQDHADTGRVFGAAYRLHKAAGAVVVNGENAVMLAALGQDVVRALDAAGRKGALRSGGSLEGVLGRLREACELVEVYGKEGWLLHMACNDHIKHDFDGSHNAVADALEAAALEVPGKPSPLPRGVYLDVNRNLRRCLKRMGGGSVAQGLKAAKVKQSLDDALEVASHLGVGAEAVSRELAALPADVPLDAYYSRMVARQSRGGGAGTPLQMGVEQCKAIFDMYDKEGVGYLDRAGLRAVLSDVGALEGLRGPEVEAAVGRAFSLADRDNDGRITAEEFARYYETLTCNSARKHLRLALGPAVEGELKQFFNDFCAFGTRQAVDEMDNAHFAKFCKDCNLLGRDLTVTDIDLAFARAKPKGSRKLSFEGFVTALAECAERKGMSLEALVRMVLSCEGPVARATKAESVRLHDDKSTYTGVYAKGGPKVFDSGHDLAAMLDRSDATKKVVSRRTTADKVPYPHPLVQQLQQAGANSLNLTSSIGSSVNPAKRRSTIGGQPNSGRLQEMWLLWANFGSGSSTAAAASNPHHHHHSRAEMGVSQFIKLVRETGLLDKAFSATQAELIFVRARPKDSAKLSYEAFERAMRLIAEAKGVALDVVELAVLKSQGPMLTARQT